MRRFSAFILLILLAPVSLSALDPFKSYIFDFWGKPVPAPQAYELDSIYKGEALGVGGFNQPYDVCAAPDGSIVISDRGNNRLVRIDADRAYAEELTRFSDSSGGFNSPAGLHYNQQGELFVADFEAGRILRFDIDGAVTGDFLRPDNDIEGAITEDFVFKPQRIAVSPVEKVYVTAEGVYDGLMEYNLDGNFAGFIGAPRVMPNVFDVFWSRFATEEQKRRIALFLPTEYAALDLDSQGFIYVVEKNNVKRLNPAGENIFVHKSFYRPVGDLPVANHAQEEASLFVDIAVRDSGIFSILDLQRGRIFTYDGVGNLLYVFGGIGFTQNLFQSPVAIEVVGDEILVLDRSLNLLFSFRPLP